MVSWVYVLVGVVVGVLVTLWVVTRRVEVALDQRYREGIEQGRYMQQLGRDDPVRDADHAISAIRRTGRLRTFLHATQREDERLARAATLVRLGAGL